MSSPTSNLTLGATKSGNLTFESFGSRTSTIKTINIASKPPSPTLAFTGDGVYQANTGEATMSSPPVVNQIITDLQAVAAVLSASSSASNAVTAISASAPVASAVTKR